jgi:hypothetical protein
MDTLTEELVTLRAKGRTWAQIEAESGIPAAQAAVRVQEYLRTSYTDTTVTDARQLQIRRLEMLMGYLWEQVEAGDFLTQGRNTTNLINVIQQVTDLLDLKSDRLRDAQIQLTQEQGGLILVILQAIQATLMNNILDTLSLQSEYNANTGKRGIEDVTAFRAVLERDWSGWFASAADKALDEAGADSNSATASMQHELARPRTTAHTAVPGNTIKGEITRGRSGNRG